MSTFLLKHKFDNTQCQVDIKQRVFLIILGQNKESSDNQAIKKAGFATSLLEQQTLFLSEIS